MRVKLSTWAKMNGYTYRGAYNRFIRHGIPNAVIEDTGRIFVFIPEEQPSKEEQVVSYARVSTTKQKDDLTRQSKRIAEFCASRGMILKNEYKEIASGLNDNRSVLNKILSDEKITTIVVEHKDRLTRFGFNYLSNFTGKKIIVMNEASEEKEDLMQDLISVITSMVARYYGNRKAKNTKEKILEVINDQN